MACILLMTIGIYSNRNNTMIITDINPSFLSWCSDAFLELNISKTKEVCIDFRRATSPTLNSTIQG